MPLFRVEGPSFWISVHLSIVFAVTYFVLFFGSVLDSPSVTVNLIDKPLETKDLCAIAHVGDEGSVCFCATPQEQKHNFHNR